MSGWRTLLAVDHDRHAVECYRANVPEAERVVCADVSDELIREALGCHGCGGFGYSEDTGAGEHEHVCGECHGSRWREPVDVLLGGPPCQPHSRGGKREGASDERDALPEAASAVALLRPRHFLFENVEGLLDKGSIEHFRSWIATLEGHGYAVEVRTLDAHRYGVPQFRKRVWTWGIRRDLHDAGARHSWPAPTHERPSEHPTMFGGLAPWVTCGEAIGCSGGDGRSRGDGWYSGGRVLDSERPSPTQTGTGSPEFVAIRRLRAESVERPDHPSHEPGPTAIHAGHGRSGLVAVERVVRTKQKRSQQSTDSPSPTLATDSRAELVERVIGGGANPRRKGAGEDREHRDITDEPSTTIATHGGNQTPSVYAAPSPTITGGSTNSHVNGRSVVQARAFREEVRRLTPDECLRLQSGPDDWVWPEVDGKPLGKTHRYRIVGNGWACGMAARMADAIRETDPEATTVVDLFCGGGLGAVGWHGRYWTPGRRREAV